MQNLNEKLSLLTGIQLAKWPTLRNTPIQMYTDFVSVDMHLTTFICPHLSSDISEFQWLHYSKIFIEYLFILKLHAFVLFHWKCVKFNAMETIIMTNSARPVNSFVLPYKPQFLDASAIYKTFHCFCWLTHFSQMVRN